MILVHAEQMINDIEPLGPARIIDCRDINQCRKPAGRIAFQKVDQTRDIGQRHVHVQLILGHIPGEHAIGAFGFDIAAKFLKLLVHRTIVPVRRILRCSCMMPYSSASAVGGQPGT